MIFSNDQNIFDLAVQNNWIYSEIKSKSSSIVRIVADENKLKCSLQVLSDRDTSLSDRDMSLSDTDTSLTDADMSLADTDAQTYKNCHEWGPRGSPRAHTR